MTATEGCCCRYGEVLGLISLDDGVLLLYGGCCGLLAIKAQTASVQVGIKRAVAASAVATRNHDPNSLQVASDASGCDYRCCDRDPHAAAAAADAMSGESLCIPLFGVMFQFESASLGFPETWLTGYVVRCIGIWVSWCGRGDSGTVLPTVLGMGTKQRCTPAAVKVSRRLAR